MMLRTLVCIAACSAAFAGSRPSQPMEHVQALAALQSRAAGTDGERRAIEYARKQLRRAGLDVAVEPFDFRTFRLESALLEAGGQSAAPTHVAFDPYSGSGDIRGEAAFVSGGRVRIGQGAVATLSPDDFERLKATGAKTARLTVEGKVSTVHSANLIAATRHGDPAREVILSAHIDSADTPGAQDNGSGVAVLLELARTLPKLNLPVRLRFVFFGAEELGLLGSRAYVERHREDLERCRMMFNMDSVGGTEMAVDIRDGVKNLPRERGLALPRDAERDWKGHWALSRRDSSGDDISNVPAWLQSAILDSAAELGYAVQAVRGVSSDHQTFTQAGYVATNLVIGGLKIHTPDDVPGHIHPESLEKARALLTAVLQRVTARATF